MVGLVPSGKGLQSKDGGFPREGALLKAATQKPRPSFQPAALQDRDPETANTRARPNFQAAGQAADLPTPASQLLETSLPLGLRLSVPHTPAAGSDLCLALVLLPWTARTSTLPLRPKTPNKIRMVKPTQVCTRARPQRNQLLLKSLCQRETL